MLAVATESSRRGADVACVGHVQEGRAGTRRAGRACEWYRQTLRPNAITVAASVDGAFEAAPLMVMPETALPPLPEVPVSLLPPLPPLACWNSAPRTPEVEPPTALSRLAAVPGAPDIRARRCLVAGATGNGGRGGRITAIGSGKGEIDRCRPAQTADISRAVSRTARPTDGVHLYRGSIAAQRESISKDVGVASPAREVGGSRYAAAQTATMAWALAVTFPLSVRSGAGIGSAAVRGEAGAVSAGACVGIDIDGRGGWADGRGADVIEER